MNEEPRTDWTYAECPTVEASILIDASVDEVWALVSDIALPTRSSPEVQSTAWLDGATEPALGARFAGHNSHAAIGEWDTECTITRFEPGRVFEWVVGDPTHPSSVWAFVIDGHDGAVELTQSMQMGPARSGLNIAIDAMPEKESRIIARRLAEHQTNMQANLDAVKRLAHDAST